MVDYPQGYYNRFDEDKHYDEHMFLAGRYLQSAELNEVQANVFSRMQGISDSLFKDGDIIRDASVIVDPATGAVQCQSGAIYIRGAVRGVAPANLTIPVTGNIAIGVRLVESVVTAVEDPELVDPAAGARSYQQPGASRLKVDPVWSTSAGSEDDFYPVYTVTDGILNARDAPPSLDSVNQSIARYDRDSTGGSYVVSGMTLKALPDSGAVQNYSLSEGRCRVFGFGFDFQTARRVQLNTPPDLKLIANEPHLSTTTSAQRVNLDRTPATLITQVTIETEKTANLIHGLGTGAQDPLPDTSVLEILSVSQGSTTYTQTTDYLLTAGRVDWSPGGAEPASGSTYTVTYRYISSVTPTAVDDDGFTVAGAVVGSNILVNYSQKLPRIDRLAIDSRGNPVWQIGVAAEFNPQPPPVPDDVLPLASVYQDWRPTRQISNDGVRVVPMPQLAAVEERLDWLSALIAQQRLESNVHTREQGTKRGLFTDPFLDESQRDAGSPNSAAIVRGELVLPITSAIFSLPADVTSPTTLAYSHAVRLSQTLRTGQMRINPYSAFDPIPARVTLTPSVDRWTIVQSQWRSSETSRFVVGQGTNSRITQSSRNALISSTSALLETLRPITVAYSIAGFGPGEAVSSMTFDGAPVVGTAMIANSSGNMVGTFTIPAGVPAGTKQFRVVGAGGTLGVANFSGQGTVERNIWQTQIAITETRWQSPPPPQPVIGPPVDPLAQTFILPENTQVSGIDLWFTVRPTTETRVQIRSTATGLPDQRVITEARIQPSAINVDGSHTRIQFPFPTTLFGGTEYAFVVLCDDATGQLAMAELGKFDSAAQRWITSQPYTVGVMLSSSNASSWTVHQDRDLAFRILSAQYTQTSRTISLGSVTVTNATDLMLMSYADRPSSGTGIKYTLTLPDSRVLTVDDGQPVQLAAPITGLVSVSAVLTGTAQFSPVLYPGLQLAVGQVEDGVYTSRGIPCGNSAEIKVIFEAIAPSGSIISPAYRLNASGPFANFTSSTNRPADDGFTEFEYTVTGVSGPVAQIAILLDGNAGARPRVRDLRVIII